MKSAKMITPYNVRKNFLNPGKWHGLSLACLLGAVWFVQGCGHFLGKNLAISQATVATDQEVHSALVLGEDLFVHEPFEARSYDPALNAKLPVRFQEDVYAASTEAGYRERGSNLGFGRSYLRNVGLCRHFAWTDLLSFLYFEKTGKRRFFSPTFLMSALPAPGHYANHMRFVVNDVQGGILREDDVLWIKNSAGLFWPENQREIGPLIQPVLKGYQHILFKNPAIPEDKLVIRNTDREVERLDDEGEPVMRNGVPVTFNPDGSYYQQMDEATLSAVKNHLQKWKVPVVLMYSEPGGRVLTPVKNQWTAQIERYDRTWPHGILIVGYDDNVNFDDMKDYDLSQPRVRGEKRIPQTKFLPSTGVFYIRDSYATETRMMSYGKFLRLGIYAESVLPDSESIESNSVVRQGN